MQSSIMDQIIRNNATSGMLMTPEEFKKLSKSKASWHHFDRPYFFFTRELNLSGAKDEKEYQDVKKSSIRHLIPYNGRYYDYIVNKEYNSLSDWAKDNSWGLEHILYGVAKKHRSNTLNPIVAYVSLETLAQYLDPNVEKPNSKDEIINDILVELSDMSHRIHCMATKLQSLL